MKRFLTLLLVASISCLPSSMLAQKGGGIFIATVIDHQGKTIDFENLNEYKVKAFLLNDTVLATTNIYSFYPYQTQVDEYFDTLITKETYDYSGRKNGLQFINYQIPRSVPGLALKPIKRFKCNYRLMIANSADTMIIDFIRVFGSNGFGYRVKIETLIFEPGYFQYKKRDRFGFDAYLDSTWIITNLEKLDYKPLLKSKEKETESYIKRAYRKLQRLWNKNSRIYNRDLNKKAQSKDRPKMPS